ncbi:MAG: hypothetical protein IKL89_05060 [Clostridia bacterium]|nr:hypothetical protein [Clostridia bacterium]
MNEVICAQRLREGNDYLIITHRNPDGDTVGSAAALCRGLRKLGKRAFVLSGASFQPRQRELLAGLLTEEC